ncbi:hypothetical protein D9M72_494040 [compost metagenome]
MTAQGRTGHAVRAQSQLVVRWENHQAFTAGQLDLRIEAEQCIEHGQRTVGYADDCLGFADGTKQFPFIDRLMRIDFARDDLACEHAKRHRAPPKGRRHISTLHLSSPFQRQKKFVRRNDVKNA